MATGFALSPQTTKLQTVSSKASHKPILATKTKTSTVTTSPKTTVVETPSVTTPVTRPVTQTVPAGVRTSNTVEPVVTPSPSSSVNSLTPTNPTTTTPTSSSTPPSTPSGSGSSTTPPSTTTTTSYTSTNWSGYLAASGNYTEVSSSWQATSPTGNGVNTSADATWIGIGGVTSSDLIQIGTENSVSASGQASTAAFYELLPNSSVNISSITVSPGDQLTASITEIASGVWNMVITDTTNNESFNLQVNYTSSNSSVEWVEEDPSYSNGRLVPFDNFGTATFTNASTISNGSTLNLNGTGVQPITLVNQSDQPIATPSSITGGGTGFTVTHS